jgi:hypothetical protein
MHEHGEDRHANHAIALAQARNASFNNGLNYYDSGRGLGFSAGHCMPLDPTDIGKDFDCGYPDKVRMR